MSTNGEREVGRGDGGAERNGCLVQQAELEIQIRADLREIWHRLSEFRENNRRLVMAIMLGAGLFLAIATPTAYVAYRHGSSPAKERVLSVPDAEVSGAVKAVLEDGGDRDDDVIQDATP